MKPTIKLALLATMVVAIISCKKEIDLKIDQYQPKLATNCLFEQDSNFYFQVTKSQSALDNDTFPPLKDVSIILTNSLGETETITKLVSQVFYYQNEQVYKSNMRARAGLTYDIQISHPDLETASASASVPEKTQITSLDTQSVLEFGYPVLRFNLSFNDPSTTNYYELKLFAYAPELIYDETNWEPIDTIMTFQEVYYSLPSDGLLGGGNSSIFSDELFNGSNYTLAFSVDKGYIEYALQNMGEFGDRKSYFLVELRSISKEYYDYQTSLNKYWNAEGNPFAQPVQVFSNIDNGFGIFAGFGKSSDTIWIE